MPRENKTKYAVLGMLGYGPLSGYDIRQIYEQSLGHFWSESYGHIYPILKRLVYEGLATRAVESNPGRPDRHVYTITDAGRDEMRRWLAQSLEPQRERVEVLLKLFHGWEAGPEVMLEHVRAFRAENEELLARYAHYDEHLRDDPSPPAPYWRTTVSCGQHISAAYVAWCDETIATLEGLPAGPRAGGEHWQPEPVDGAGEGVGGRHDDAATKETT